MKRPTSSPSDKNPEDIKKPTPSVPPAPPTAPPPPFEFQSPDEVELSEEILNGLFTRLNERELTTQELQNWNLKILALLMERDQLVSCVHEGRELLAQKEDTITSLREDLEEARGGSPVENPRKKVGMIAAASVLLVLSGAGGNAYFAKGTDSTPSSATDHAPNKEPTPMSTFPPIDLRGLLEQSLSENQEVSDLLKRAARGEILNYYEMDRIRTFQESVITRVRQQFDTNILDARQAFNQERDERRAALDGLIDQRRQELNKQVDEIRIETRLLSERGQTR